MVFTGTYEHTIDAKHRLAIPSEVRDLIYAAAGKRAKTVFLYVTLGEGQSLYLYTEDRFDQRAAELIGSQLDPDQLLVYERMWFSLARRVELDGAGRIRLPENLIRRAGLGNEVVLLGNNDHLEIRDRDKWNAYLEQALAEQSHLLIMNPRRAIGRTRSNQMPG